MTIAPLNVTDVTSALTIAHQSGGKIARVDTRALSKVIEHKAEDMTATVEAGITLHNFQQQLAQHNQWLPIDPPRAETITIRDILEENASGPRRFGYGTIRDYVIGMTVALADGRLIHSGGKVVKNVAGYDLMKLFIGSHGTLGIIVEVTFKILPRPEAEQFVEARLETLDAAGSMLDRIFDSELAPKVLDLHATGQKRGPFYLVLGFAGTKAEVEWQISLAAKLGVNQPSTLDYQEKFFAAHSEFQKTSVAPSKLTETIRDLGDTAFVARSGNGVIYHLHSLKVQPQERPIELEHRLKMQFDPKQILNSF